MAQGAIHCSECDQALAFHCPDSNVNCTWLACHTAGCSVRYYDVGRGLVQHTDGTVVGWDDMPTTTEPPVITIEDETADGEAG